MKTGDKVEKNGEYGVIMNINNSVAHVWWNVQGKYNWEPCDIATLNLILADEEVDEVVLQEEGLTDNDVDRLVDWVLSVKSATS